MLISRRLRAAACLVCAGVLAAGCGGAQEGAAVPAGATTAPTGTTTTSMTTSAPTTTTTPPPPPPPTAADGGDYSACADGSCEVYIAQPGRINFKGGSLLVTALHADGIDIDLKMTRGGGGTGTLKGTCGSIFRFTGTGGNGTFCNPDGTTLPAPEPQPGVVALQMLGINNGAAVLRIVAG